MDYRTYFNRMVNQYLDTADWTDEDALAEDAAQHGIEIIGWHSDAFTVAERACRDFLGTPASDDEGDERTLYDVLTDANIGPESVGQDLWLTRNGHGAGFWDRGYPAELDTLLTTAAKSMGSSDTYVDDDGYQYLT